MLYYHGEAKLLPQSTATHVGVGHSRSDELGERAEDEEVPVGEGSAASDARRARALGAPRKDSADQALKGGVLLSVDVSSARALRSLPTSKKSRPAV